MRAGFKPWLRPLTSCNPTWVPIFSKLFSIQFLWCTRGEFDKQSRSSLLGKHSSIHVFDSAEVGMGCMGISDLLNTVRTLN